MLAFEDLELFGFGLIRLCKVSRHIHKTGWSLLQTFRRSTSNLLIVAF